jgi:hypothetical protein
LKRVSPFLQITQLPVALQNILHVLQKAAILFFQHSFIFPCQLST